MLLIKNLTFFSTFISSQINALVNLISVNSRSSCRDGLPYNATPDSCYISQANCSFVAKMLEC